MIWLCLAFIYIVGCFYYRTDIKEGVKQVPFAGDWEYWFILLTWPFWILVFCGVIVWSGVDWLRKKYK